MIRQCLTCGLPVVNMVAHNAGGIDGEPLHAQRDDAAPIGFLALSRHQRDSLASKYNRHAPATPRKQSLYACVRTHAHMHICTHAHADVHVHVCVHKCTNTQAHRARRRLCLARLCLARLAARGLDRWRSWCASQASRRQLSKCRAHAQARLTSTHIVHTRMAVCARRHDGRGTAVSECGELAAWHNSCTAARSVGV